GQRIPPRRSLEPQGSLRQSGPRYPGVLGTGTRCRRYSRSRNPRAADPHRVVALAKALDRIPGWVYVGIGPQEKYFESHPNSVRKEAPVVSDVGDSQLRDQPVDAESAESPFLT